MLELIRNSIRLVGAAMMGVFKGYLILAAVVAGVACIGALVQKFFWKDSWTPWLRATFPAIFGSFPLMWLCTGEIPQKGGVGTGLTGTAARVVATPFLAVCVYLTWAGIREARARRDTHSPEREKTETNTPPDPPADAGRKKNGIRAP